MALTNEQVREILTAAGVDEDHMKSAQEKIISGHLESVNALRLDVEKYRGDIKKRRPPTEYSGGSPLGRSLPPSCLLTG